MLRPTMMARYARRPASGFLQHPGPWKNGPVPVVGLIGGIGAGKSQVAAQLAERGAVVVDADAVGHALLDQTPTRNQVLRRFGAGVLDRSASPDGPPRIDRRALSAIVFSQPGALRDLEAILHPRMRKTFERAIDRAARKGQATAVVLDAAVLLEAGWNDVCDVVVFVDAPLEQRLAHLAAQRGWTSETLQSRERMQWTLDAKRRSAHHVVANTADKEALREAVDRLWPLLITPSRDARSTSTRAARSRDQVPAPRGGPP